MQLCKLSGCGLDCSHPKPQSFSSAENPSETFCAERKQLWLGRELFEAIADERGVVWLLTETNPTGHAKWILKLRRCDSSAEACLILNVRKLI